LLSDISQVLCGHHPYVEIVLDILVSDAITSGVRPKKPEGATRLGFTEGLWKKVERCWLEDRGARPSVEDILPYLNDATLRWYTGTATPSNRSSRPISVQARIQTRISTRTSSPLARTWGSDNESQGSNDLDYLPLQQSTSASSDHPSTCRLNGCDTPVFAGSITESSIEYCSQRHRE
jgi:hypothetical protein